MNEVVLPALVMMLGAALVPFLKGAIKKAYLLALPLASLYNVWQLQPGVDMGVYDFLGQQLILARIDPLSRAFVLIFHVVALIALLYCFHFDNDVEFTTGLVYAGAAVGAVTAGDYFSFYAYWEVLGLAATFLILNRQTDKARAAAVRYLLLHFAGGLLLLYGLLSYITATGTSRMGPIGLAAPGAWAIFLGLGLNCAWPLLHTWVTDAYPEATIGGIIFLSAFTTKTAVYALARCFEGAEPLIYIGAVMTVFPIFYAVIENDLRRVLAYSMVNQVGFMVVGIGIGTHLAVNGAIAHAFNDILFKGLLFMAVGAAMLRTGTANCTGLGGLYKSMPWSCAFCLVGAASISAVPGFSGFVSKSLIVSSAAEEHHIVVWFALVFASAGVLHHAGIKIPFFTFFSHDAGHRVKEAPAPMLAAMGLSAAACVVIGCFPYQTVYRIVPYAVDYQPYTGGHILEQLQLLSFAGLAFGLMLLGGFDPAEKRVINLDFDWFYRKGSRLFYGLCDRSLNDLNEAADTAVMRNFLLPLRARLRHGLGGFVVPLAALALRLSRTPAQVEAWQERAYRRLERTALPIGLSALYAIILLGLLYLF
ncbi:MAG: Na(+)/H(+) antiporter subunit D [Vulcanimicrobiota bacterium]